MWLFCGVAVVGSRRLCESCVQASVTRGAVDGGELERWGEFRESSAEHDSMQEICRWLQAGPQMHLQLLNATDPCVTCRAERAGE